MLVNSPNGTLWDIVSSMLHRYDTLPPLQIRPSKSEDLLPSSIYCTISIYIYLYQTRSTSINDLGIVWKCNSALPFGFEHFTSSCKELQQRNEKRIWIIWTIQRVSRFERSGRNPGKTILAQLRRPVPGLGGVSNGHEHRCHHRMTSPFFPHWTEKNT